MKKIIAIASMVAVAASVAFAAEASVSIKSQTNLLNYDRASGDVSVLSPKQNSEDTNLTFTFSTERVGANLKLRLNEFGGSGSGLADGFSIWFKPIDILKVTAGGVGAALSPILQQNYGNGLQLDVDTNGVTVAAGIGSDWGRNGYDNYFANASDQNADNGSAWGKFGYTIDGVGTVAAGVYYNAKIDWLQDKWHDDLKNQKIEVPNLGTYKTEGFLAYPLLGFGAGFAGSLDDVGLSYALDAAGYLYRKEVRTKDPDDRNSLEFDGAGVAATVGYAANGFSADLFVPVFIWTNSDIKDLFDYVDGNGTPVWVGTGLTLAYDLGGVKPYVELTTVDWLAKNYLKIDVKPGVSGTFAGALSWDVAFDAHIAPKGEDAYGPDNKNFWFDIPVTFSVSF